MLVKIAKYICFCVHRRSYLLWSPAIVHHIPNAFGVTLTTEMTCKIVEYAEQDLTGVLSGMSALRLATGPHRRRDQGSAAPAHVMVVDGNMREDALADLARSVDKVIFVLFLRRFRGVHELGRVGSDQLTASMGSGLDGSDRF